MSFEIGQKLVVLDDAMMRLKSWVDRESIIYDNEMGWWYEAAADEMMIVSLMEWWRVDRESIIYDDEMRWWYAAAAADDNKSNKNDDHDDDDFD